MSERYMQVSDVLLDVVALDGDTVRLVVDRKQVLPQYLFLWLNQNRSTSSDDGVDVVRNDVLDVLERFFPVPSLEEQERAVEEWLI